MTRDYSALEKKVEELESQLQDFFALPVDTPRLQLISDFLVLKNLLSAEFAALHDTAAGDEDDPEPESRRRLEDVGRRVSENEAAFRNWDEVRTPALDCIDAASLCSCAESSHLNEDDGDDRGLPARPEMAAAAGSVGGGGRRKIWRKLGAVAGGMAAGAVLMGAVMAEYSCCFLHYHMRYDEFFPTPT